MLDGEGAFAFVMGIISGYPVGAKIAADFRKNNVCSKEECERLLSFTNNSGPLFIVGTVGISMFGSSNIGLTLFLSHILASISVGIIFRFWKFNKKFTNDHLKSSFKKSNYKNVNLGNIGQIIAESITSSISTILIIGGFMVVFSAVISIFNASGFTNLVVMLFSPIFKTLNLNCSFITGLFTGFFEITNGINLIANINVKSISINIIFVSFLLGFGGISIMLQVLSIISKTDLSAKPYVIGKLLHGIIASIYTYLLVTFIPMLNLDLH